MSRIAGIIVNPEWGIGNRGIEDLALSNQNSAFGHLGFFPKSFNLQRLNAKC
jgi:hypothetical protein